MFDRDYADKVRELACSPEVIEESEETLARMGISELRKRVAVTAMETAAGLSLVRVSCVKGIGNDPQVIALLENRIKELVSMAVAIDPVAAGESSIEMMTITD